MHLRFLRFSLLLSLTALAAATGTAALTVSGVVTTVDFTTSSNCGVLPVGASTRAQDIPTLHAESHLIDFSISVHDAAGAVVTDLAQNEMTVVEDGTPQTIRFFSRLNQLPLSIGLLLDVSGSQERFVKKHEQDVAEFLKGTLLPEDRAFIVCFGNHLRLVSDWSADSAALLSGLRAFDKGERKMPVIGPDEDRELGTALYDAVYFAAREKLATQRERTRILIVFSDGEENSSEHDLIDAITAAQDGNTLVYAIRYTELEHGRTNARNRYGMRALDHLTQQTGGQTFDAGTMSLKQAFAAIAADARSLYSVAYQSTHLARDGRFRNVVLGVARPGVTVRARAGYYAH